MIEFVDGGAIVSADKVAFTYATTETPRELHQLQQRETFKWTERQDYIGDYIIYPFGDNNNLPEQIKQVVFNNSLAPGILNKRAQLLWGSGPLLYAEDITGGKVVRTWTKDNAIQGWLNKWDYKDYILRCANDYQYQQSCFSKIILTRGSRLGNNFIHSLEHVQPDEARLAKLRASESKKPTHVVVTDYSFSGPHSMEYSAYELFDSANPFAAANSILYSNLYSYCMDFYTMPELYGTFEWIRNSTAVPLIIKAFSKHSLHYKFHIESPAGYWEAKKKIIEANCVKKGIKYTESMLEELQRNTLNAFSEVLSGVENTGKYMHTIKVVRYEGANLIEEGWSVKFIDQKVKEFIDAQVAIADRSDRALSSAIGMHGALSNLSDKGESGSGSEQLYALKTFMATGIAIPEMIVLKAMNYALTANFPDSGLRMGFYHEVPEKEQDVNPKNRMVNNT